ncbi:hypothetical protein LOC67_15975 [Stieleria sp. JC731]|uniref:tetratricopeptide repeat protein n=2 Tax=Pirellulaceae TaxID=2691357 RepID=UPI001E339DD8|nr:tetratricopeptide repeat protein [Stieleria sp. JC731]MCC9602061.1 hypothetical protein [Stieleria sp. JC731]
MQQSRFVLQIGMASMICWSLLASPLIVAAESIGVEAVDVAASLVEVRKLRDAGEFASAVGELQKLASYLIEESRSDVQLAADFVLLARAAQSDISPEQVDELYVAAEQWLQRNDVSSVSLKQHVVLTTAIATHHASRQRAGQAQQQLLRLFDEIDRSNDEAEGALAASIADPLLALSMKSAWQAMSGGDAEGAEKLYLAMQGSDSRGSVQLGDARRSLCQLGLGWATALQPDRHVDAAERLGVFIDQNPDHSDAAKASALRVRCAIKADQNAELLDAIDLHFKEYGDTSGTADLVAEVLRQVDPIPEIVKEWLLQEQSYQQWPLSLVSESLVQFGSDFSPRDFDALVTRLTVNDKAGAWTAQTLEGCDAIDHSAISELIAAAVIGGRIGGATMLSVEAATRWAGRTGRWSMLMHAAEDVDFESDPEGRSVHVDRLFAEAVFRSGQRAKALRYWKHVVDVRKADDFGTLLRCAECSVLVDDVEQAEVRLRRLREILDSAETAPISQKPLVELLEADLAIRKLKFDHSRSLLESVVRSPESPAPIRARAQWMIGETYLLQQNYAEAIDAYRLVEGIDPGGPYAAAALVQAGKAFEQLGRTREASVCYGTLLEKFADSSYASEARHRMSALPTHSPSNTRR